MLLIDADILCYRVGFACNDEVESWAVNTLNQAVDNVLLRYPEVDRELYLTGKGNFREEVAVTATYKGNRDRGKDRPVHFDALRTHLVGYWDAQVIDGMEADDAIATRHTSLNYSSIIVSIDKDFKQLPGRHYNFVKNEEFYVTPEEAMKFLYEQILTGDKSDNIIGIHGIGPVKAQKILKDCVTEHDCFMACVKAYEELDGCLYPATRVRENARLLYLLRKEGDQWKEPLMS